MYVKTIEEGRNKEEGAGLDDGWSVHHFKTALRPATGQGSDHVGVGASLAFIMKATEWVNVCLPPKSIPCSPWPRYDNLREVNTTNKATDWSKKLSQERFFFALVASVVCCCFCCCCCSEWEGRRSGVDITKQGFEKE